MTDERSNRDKLAAFSRRGVVVGGIAAGFAGGLAVATRSGAAPVAVPTAPMVACLPGVISDLRQVIPSKLLAYWDVRPTVSGGYSSLTAAAALRATGSASPPTVTISGPSVVRQVIITYSLGGALGTAEYVINLGDSVLYGATSASPVSIGGGNSITFGAGTYVATTPTGGHTHQLVVDSWAELTGLANATLTSALIGVGSRYEAHGLNGVCPSLSFLSSCLSNETGVPALVSGTDVDFEVWTTQEAWKHISGVGAMVPWAFSNQTDTTKSYIRAVICGPTTSGQQSRLAIQKRDSSGSPATVTHVANNLYSDLDPHVTRSIISASGQQWVDGMPSRVSGGSPSATDLRRFVATNLDRFSVGHVKLGTAAFSTANPFQGRMSAIAITDPLSDAEALDVMKAMAAA